ncbi:hypothetical protein RM697_13690, partial [Ichthyenterobacterium sp. W332]|nr:hypothetical protein [Ichthyenterobacterium sp. W332]
INDVSDLTVNACDYADQAALDAAFSSWLDGFGFSGGCDPEGTDLSNLTAPDLCGGNDMSEPSVWINEFHYDNPGSDVGEFVEVAGTAGFDLTGYSIVLYNGNGGASYNTTSLSGSIDDEGSSGFGAVSFAISGIQNGEPDGIALVNASNEAIEFISYEGSFTATNGPANGMTSTDVGISEPGEDDESIQLTGMGSTGSDFAWSGPSAESPGDLNAGQTVLSSGGSGNSV